MLIESVRNKHLDELDGDELYHFALNTKRNDLREMFHDVKLVCMGGSAERSEIFANEVYDQVFSFDNESFSEDIANQIGVRANDIVTLHREGFELDLSDFRSLIGDILREAGRPRPIGKTERFSMYKIGPVISVNHQMGMSPLSILLNELTKILHYAGAQDVRYMRMGTSGGNGVEGGTVVLAEEALNAKLKPHHEVVALGKTYKYPTTLDAQFNNDLYECRGEDIPVIIGKTMGTDCFYEGQGRLDGALQPPYTERQKMNWLKKCHKAGVRNFEMEAPGFASWGNRAGIPSAIACAALLNRLNGDQVTSSPAELASFSANVYKLVIRYIQANRDQLLGLTK